MTQQKSERKKNKKTAVIVALLLALIALLCFGGYTFSKYVTSGSGTGTAQVAKWGYTIEVNGDNLFGNKYKFDGVASKATAEENNLTVKASGDYNVIAPGTTGSMTFNVTGQAEVKALVSMFITEAVHNEGIKDIVLKVQKAGGNEIVYNPVKWTLKKKTKTQPDMIALPGMKETTLHNVAGAFHDMIYNSASSVKNPGDVLEETTYELVWEWPYEGTGTFEGVTADELDTILGRRAKDASYASYGDWTIKEVCTEIKLQLDMQVTQLDRNWNNK